MAEDHPPICLVDDEQWLDRASAEGRGVADGQRLCPLVRQTGPVRDRTFEIEFLDAGAEAFVFTFG